MAVDQQLHIDPVPIAGKQLQRPALLWAEATFSRGLRHASITPGEGPVRHPHRGSARKRSGRWRRDAPTSGTAPTASLHCFAEYRGLTDADGSVVVDW